MDATKNGNYVCTRCGGTNLVFDANATFNNRTGLFELTDVRDGVFCYDCGEKTRDEWREPHE